MRTTFLGSLLYFSACRLNLKQDYIADIPPFRGGSHRNSMTTTTTSSTNKHALRYAMEYIIAL